MTTKKSTNDIDGVRSTLFDLLDDLKSGKETDTDKAKLMVSACDSIIETAKVEVAYLKVIESREKSAFLEAPKLKGPTE